MFAPAVAFVDLETTGTVAAEDRVTEVGIVRVDDGARVSEWSTLVNPECSIPAEIQGLTGITSAMVARAPTFRQIADEITSRIEGCVFVAHNARFDYGFLKHEFGRLGRAFTARVLCTVKLSRRLLTVHSTLAVNAWPSRPNRSEEHTSELQSRRDLVCRLLLEKKKNKINSDATSLFSSAMTACARITRDLDIGSSPNRY